MNSDEFVALCVGATSKAQKKRKKTGTRVGFPEYGYSSVPGGNIHGDMPALPGTSADCGCGDAGGCCCGESVDSNSEFSTYLEGLGAQYPHSDVVSQVKKMFSDMQNGKYNPMYCSADGISTRK